MKAYKFKAQQFTLIKTHQGGGVCGRVTEVEKNAYINTKQKKKVSRWKTSKSERKEPSPNPCNNFFESLIVTTIPMICYQTRQAFQTNMLGIYPMKTVNTFSATKKKRKNACTEIS